VVWVLQNHYRDREYPVRSRSRHARQVQQARAARLSSISAGEALVRVAPALVLLVVLMVLRSRISPQLPPGAQDGYPVLVAIVCLTVTVLGVIGGSLRDRSLPVREQRRYRQLTGAAEVSAHQQQLLTLDAQSDFAFGGWNSSLEYAPSWRCLPPATRRTWEHRATWLTGEGPSRPGSDRKFDGGRPLFRTLPMAPVATQRADIDARHHIASGQDVPLYVADLLGSGARAGGISARFAAAAAGADGDRVIARLASLTGRDEFELRALTEPVGGRPPELLVGADVQWAVSVVRLCYVAEHVEASTAWQLIEGAGARAADRFTSWAQYWASVRTGVAFASDSLEAVQRFDARLAELYASAWPAARTPWFSAVSSGHALRDGGLPPSPDSDSDVSGPRRGTGDAHTS